MFASGFSFAAMAVSVRFAGSIPLAEKVLFRNIIAIGVSFILIKKAKASVFGKKENFIYLLGRAIFGTTAMALYFWSIMKIPIADATMLNNLSPFVVTLLAWLFLKEKLSKMQIPALVIVFFASWLIIKPTFDLNMIPSVAGAFSALLSGSAYILVRYLGDKENPATVVFFFSLVSTLLVLPFALINFQMPRGIELYALIGIGVFASGGQMAITYAYKMAKASEISFFTYVNVLFSVFFGWVIWNEMPDLLSIIGGLIIIFSSIFLFRYNHNQSKKNF